MMHKCVCSQGNATEAPAGFDTPALARNPGSQSMSPAALTETLGLTSAYLHFGMGGSSAFYSAADILLTCS
jgi:hypothetical protein